MIDLIKYEKGFVQKSDIDKIYNYAKNSDDLFFNFGNSEKEFTFHIGDDIKKRDPDTLELIDYHAKRVYDFVVNAYQQKFEDFDYSKTHIARFSEGTGMHEHFDSSKPNDIATLIYINDNYSGGEIYFPEYDISIKPEAGDLLTFPDNPMFVHGVRPITSGIRYTTPRWFTSIV